jgi:hypothetical protein
MSSQVLNALLRYTARGQIATLCDKQQVKRHACKLAIGPKISLAQDTFASHRPALGGLAWIFPITDKEIFPRAGGYQDAVAQPLSKCFL